MIKMTFTVDEATADVLKRLAKRLQKPQSYILREAIRYYEPNAGGLTLDESRRRVEVFKKLAAKVPRRPAAAVDSELRGIRKSRRKGWRG
jgi:hypothetical protein